MVDEYIGIRLVDTGWLPADYHPADRPTPP
jgi:hypothetical protein